MSSRDEPSQPPLPLGVLFILSICIFSLAFHFIVEGLAIASERPALELAEQGGHSHPAHDHCEDHFTFSFLARLPVERAAASSESPALTSALTFSNSPLLPPPNS
jgi:hypothetical protein